MSTFVLLAIWIFLEVLNEVFMTITRKIKAVIKLTKHKRAIREKRGYYRIPLKTRIRYKLESFIDYIITPN